MSDQVKSVDAVAREQLAALDARVRALEGIPADPVAAAFFAYRDKARAATRRTREEESSG